MNTMLSAVDSKLTQCYQQEIANERNTISSRLQMNTMLSTVDIVNNTMLSAVDSK